MKKQQVNDKSDLQKKIMKFSKDKIVKSMCFSCLNPERVYKGCLEFEIDKKEQEIKKLDKILKNLRKEVEDTPEGYEMLKLRVKIDETFNKIDKLYDEIFALQEKFIFG